MFTLIFYSGLLSYGPSSCSVYVDDGKRSKILLHFSSKAVKYNNDPTFVLNSLNIHSTMLLCIHNLNIVNIICIV